MHELFDRKVKVIPAIISILLLGGAFYSLVNTTFILNFCIILIAGLIGIYLMYGWDGIKKLYSPLKKGSTKIILIAYILSWVTSLLAKFLAESIGQPTADNPIVSQFNHGLGTALSMFGRTLFMLPGEEIITMIPLILLVHVALHYNIERKTAIIGSVILTSLMFGALHLSTYDWNWFQCLIVIGLTRIPFTWATLKTDSLWAGTIIHIAFDWLIFIGVLLASLVH
ncbi:CPBP family intramembrane glutamic endopeptidase [Enterococcus termitis]|jgi:membrane protease YdiL (CAAX protease family)|uniref:CAAX prenyl protease 2/Lysostaphin resistance protein A-like domain-containing protein n=1 Tax=Enterococcus termitis TaxID=332950 RepID=A0A1E5GDC3_9ENTE|nr:CPBP family intramembrane glutamic endopeptidase [Enterococcus termitis]OEG10585.1 hypothetical protein BCR25_08950 [Enterococcus termitis]